MESKLLKWLLWQFRGYEYMTQQLRLALSQVESNLREKQFIGREDRSKQIQLQDAKVYF
jgi:hypothetical protein